MPTTFSYFDNNHWLRVYFERRRLGLPEVPEHKRIMLGHPYVGGTLRHKATGKVYKIERVLKDFYYGYCLKLLASCNGSHTVLWFANLSSTSEAVKTAITNFEADYEVLPYAAKVV